MVEWRRHALYDLSGDKEVKEEKIPSPVVDRVESDLKSLLKTIAAIGGSIAMAWTLVTWLDIRPVLSRELKPVWNAVGEVQRGVQFINYQIYSERVATMVLSPQEQAEYCTIAEILKLPGQGCR